MAQTEMAKVLMEEKMTIPPRLWLNSIALVLVVVIFALAKPHWALYTLIAIITLAQINLIRNRYDTTYRVTSQGLDILQKNHPLIQIPYNSMIEMHEGSFRQLVTMEQIRKMDQAKDVVAYPKLGGVTELSLLLYTVEGARKAVFIQPSLTMRLFLADIIKSKKVEVKNGQI